MIPYLTGLRNPNSLAFLPIGAGASWLYLALTDRLLRYRYRAGDNAPAEKPEVLATFPDYGLSYKYGGWHLTRTIVIGGNGKVYVSVGSSCNACEEKEEVRASVLEMDPDGRHPRYFARGLRNAVGMSANFLVSCSLSPGRIAGWDSPLQSPGRPAKSASRR